MHQNVFSLYKRTFCSKIVRKFRIFLKKNPNDFDALYNKATTLYDMDQYEDALDTFDTALKIDSKNSND